MEHKVDSFKLRIWAIPEFLLKNYKLGPRWYKEASAEDMDHHVLDCHIRQQGGISMVIFYLGLGPIFQKDKKIAFSLKIKAFVCFCIFGLFYWGHF